MWWYVALIFLALVALIFIADKLCVRYYKYRLEVEEAKFIAKKIDQIVLNAPGSEFYLTYENEEIWLTGVKQIARNAPLPIWQRLLKILTNSETITIEFVLRRTPPVDIKLTAKKNPSA